MVRTRRLRKVRGEGKGCGREVLCPQVSSSSPEPQAAGMGSAGSALPDPSRSPESETSRFVLCFFLSALCSRRSQGGCLHVKPLPAEEQRRGNLLFVLQASQGTRPESTATFNPYEPEGAPWASDRGESCPLSPGVSAGEHSLPPASSRQLCPRFASEGTSRQVLRPLCLEEGPAQGESAPWQSPGP